MKKEGESIRGKHQMERGMKKREQILEEIRREERYAVMSSISYSMNLSSELIRANNYHLIITVIMIR